jgi:hypothetical protein
LHKTVSFASPMALELALSELSKCLQVCPTFDLTLSSVKLLVQNYTVNLQPEKPKKKKKKKPHHLTMHCSRVVQMLTKLTQFQQ